jgi:dolichyl-phosphate beta-glucosyltransferase
MPGLQQFPFSLSVVIPTYKEARRLPQTLDEIIAYLKRRFPKFEIIIVDDNSPDGTLQIVADYQLRHPEISLIVHPYKIGKGAAVRHGCMKASCDYVLFMDADHATPIPAVEDFFPHLSGRAQGAVVGVRPQYIGDSLIRYVISRICKLMARVIVFQKNPVKDSQCGFKMFTADTAAKLFPYARVNGGMIDVELFLLLDQFQIACRQVPVNSKNKSGTRINFLVCMVRDPIDLLRISFRGMAGVYKKPVLPEFQPWNIAGELSEKNLPVAEGIP